MTDRDTLMPFGKYKGESIASIPRYYLNWLLEQEWFYDLENLYLAVKDECDMRDRSYDDF